MHAAGVAHQSNTRCQLSQLPEFLARHRDLFPGYMGIHDSLLLLSSDRSDVSRASTQLARIVLGVFMASLLRVIVYGGG